MKKRIIKYILKPWNGEKYKASEKPKTTVDEDIKRLREEIEREEKQSKKPRLFD